MMGYNQGHLDSNRCQGKKETPTTPKGFFLEDFKSTDRDLKNLPLNNNKCKYSLLQEKLRNFYLQDYERSVNKLKMHFYSQADRPVQFLSRRVRILQAKNKIPYNTSESGGKVHHPRKITKAFATYYSDLQYIILKMTTPFPFPLRHPLKRSWTKFCKQKYPNPSWLP